MYNYFVYQLQTFKHYIQPLIVPDPITVSDPFQGITLIFRQKIYEQDQTMYNYMVAKLQNVKLQMQSMVKFLDLNKVHERNQMMLQNSKLQMQPQSVPVSDLSLSKVTSQKTVVSDYLNPYFDPVQAIAQVFSETSKFFTTLQCDLEPEINKPTSWKIVVSSNLSSDPSADLASRMIVVLSDLAPDPSAGIDFKGVIAKGFRGKFLLNSSWRDLNKLTKDEN